MEKSFRIFGVESSQIDPFFRINRAVDGLQYPIEAKIVLLSASILTCGFCGGWDLADRAPAFYSVQR